MGHGLKDLYQQWEVSKSLNFNKSEKFQNSKQ